MGEKVCLFGPLADPALARVVLGETIASRPLDIPSAGLAWDPVSGAARLVAGQGVVPGVLADLDEAAIARLSHYLQALGGGLPSHAGLGLCPDFPDLAKGRPFAPGADLAMASAVARVLMRHFPDLPAARLARRLPQILTEAASSLRAEAEPAPEVLRRAAVPGDIRITARRQPYSGFFAMEEVALTHRRFDGGQSPEILRAVFLTSDAVTVLPYDPVRDRVLLVEQFRAGPLVRGEANPWQLEAIAGRIDAGEKPAEAALREAVEEAGLTLDINAMRAVAAYYPSPGTSAERLYSYVALCDLPDGIAGLHGLAGEAEDIRGHLVAFDQLMALVQSGEIGNAPTILTALWLARERAGLRAAGG